MLTGTSVVSVVVFGSGVGAGAVYPAASKTGKIAARTLSAKLGAALVNVVLASVRALTAVSISSTGVLIGLSP